MFLAIRFRSAPNRFPYRPYQYAHPVGLWNSAGALIASVTIPQGTPSTVNANFAYVNLTSPILLNANETYIIGALNPVGSDYNPRQGDITFAPEITFLSWMVADATELMRPDIETDFPIAAANLDVSVIPEPAGMALLGMIFLAGFTIFQKRLKRLPG